MRTTVDIPDAIYRELKARAAREGTSVKQVILRGVKREMGLQQPEKPSKGLRFPLLKSKQPGSLKLGEEGVYEYIPFP